MHQDLYCVVLCAHLLSPGPRLNVLTPGILMKALLSDA